MTTTNAVLIQSKQAEASQVTQYVSNGVVSVITRFTATNTSTSSATITVHLVADGGSPNNGNLVISKTIGAGRVYRFPELSGHTLSPGGYISTIASVANSITIRASGVTQS